MRGKKGERSLTGRGKRGEKEGVSNSLENKSGKKRKADFAIGKLDENILTARRRGRSSLYAEGRGT